MRYHSKNKRDSVITAPLSVGRESPVSLLFRSDLETHSNASGETRGVKADGVKRNAQAELLRHSNVRTNAHGVSKLELPGIGSYNEVNLPTTPEDDRDSGRQLIEPRNPFKWNNSTGTWDATTDSPATRELKIARKAGLYILVNPRLRTG